MMIGTLTHPRSQYPAREQVDVLSPKAKPSDRRGVGMLARPRTFRPKALRPEGRAKPGALPFLVRGGAPVFAKVAGAICGSSPSVTRH